MATAAISRPLVGVVLLTHRMLSGSTVAGNGAPPRQYRPRGDQRLYAMSWFVGNKGIAKHHANRKTTMAYTELRFRDEARTKTLAGVAALSDAVRITLGPESWAELIEKNWGSPLVCDDGVTIAKAVKLKDPVESASSSKMSRSMTSAVPNALAFTSFAWRSKCPHARLHAMPGSTKVRWSTRCGPRPVSSDSTHAPKLSATSTSWGSSIRPRSCGLHSKNAVGVAGTLLLAEATLVEIEEPADRSTPTGFE